MPNKSGHSLLSLSLPYPLFFDDILILFCTPEGSHKCGVANSILFANSIMKCSEFSHVEVGIPNS
ncbi:hypothetical protein HanIR_Chr17g0849191 [Helianthus annuus]|nr:hypothetical protein HanIR_Chr17g0849191 [Helianthus annuus]